MDIIIAAIGKLKAGPQRVLAEDYLGRARRAGGAAGIAAITVREFAESTARSAAGRRREEARRLADAVAGDGYTVALDEAGETIDSAAFARLIGAAGERGTRRLVMLLGGPDGLERRLIDEADACIAFGRMTWPHRLARIMLAEQIYRAVTILVNHPYHRW